MTRPPHEPFCAFILLQLDVQWCHWRWSLTTWLSLIHSSPFPTSSLFSELSHKKLFCLEQSSHGCVQCGYVYLNFTFKQRQGSPWKNALTWNVENCCDWNLFFLCHLLNLFLYKKFLCHFLQQFLSVPYFTWSCVSLFLIYFYWPNRKIIWYNINLVYANVAKY